MLMEWPRLPRVPADIRVYFGQRGADHLGFVQDISMEGMRIRARKGYPPNTPLHFNVEVPGQGMVPQKGTVKRTRPVQPAIPPNEPVEMGIVIVQGNKFVQEMVTNLLKEFFERRKTLRKEVQLKVTLGNVRRMIEEFTHDIGDGGIFVVTENPPPKGEILPVTLVLPDSLGDVRAECEVAHLITSDEAACHGQLPGCGLRFLAFSRNDEEKYNNYLDRLRKND